MRFYIFIFLIFSITDSFGQTKKLKNPSLKDYNYQAEIGFDTVKNSDFSGCNFHTSDFQDSRFIHFGNFNHATFNKYANFEEADFDKGISFKSAVFNDDFSIYRLDINDTVNFDSAIFKKEARFERMDITKPINFSNCTFESRISFIDMRLSEANFSHLHLTENTEFAFHNSSADKLDFSFNPKIYNEIRLIDAFDEDPDIIERNTFSKRSLINLYKSDISKFYLDYLNFKLYFPKYSDPTNNIDSTEITSYEKQVIYEALLNNFRNHDQADSYRLLDIEYQSFKYDIEGHFIYKWLSKYWWNFGYNKEYIFIWTFGLLIFFSLLNSLVINLLNNKIYKIDNIPILSKFKPIIDWKSMVRNTYLIFERFWYSLVYTTIIFFKVSLKIENFNFKYIGGTVYLFFVYIVGLICLGYMANFVLQK